MKKTLIAVALAACAGTQLFAQSAKEDVISVSLTRYAQQSVSTSSTAANAGFWTDPPTIYKTATSKLTEVDIMRSIGIVLFGNSSHYGSNSKLVLVQGELGGFFGYPYADTLDDTSTIDGDNIRLAAGRNSQPNPLNGALPPGHNQPWGQFFVKTYNSKGEVTACDNVSFFFAIQVQECYDCFYLNSFISDSKFVFKGKQGPPCCAGSSVTDGSGKDRYYMTLQFDNTINNPYLNPFGVAQVIAVSGGVPSEVTVAGSTNTFTVASDEFNEDVLDIYPNMRPGLVERDDGVGPDGLPYENSILSVVHTPLDSHSYDIFTLRFSLNGIVTYTWNLKFVNKTDAFPDFVGNATYPVTGYGYVQKVCSLFDGTVNFRENIVSTVKCCLDEPWKDNSEFVAKLWWGIGDNDKGADINTPVTGDIENYFDSAIEDGHLGDMVPVNSDLDLSFHANFNHNYEPIEQAITDPVTGLPVEWPQPGFEGTWANPLGHDLVDVQANDTQADDRDADLQPD
jgi:hypothetical protein